jgi:hypothetical protein
VVLDWVGRAGKSESRWKLKVFRMTVDMPTMEEGLRKWYVSIWWIEDGNWRSRNIDGN